MKKKQGVILEGADQSGKSTLAALLADRYGMRVIHNKVPEPGADLVAEYTRDAADGVVYDRSYFSELVYGPVCRGISAISLRDKWRIERRLYAEGYRMILCDRAEFSMASWEERDEAFSYEQVLTVKRRFLELFMAIALPKIIVDPFEVGVMTTIEQFMGKEYRI